MQSTTIPKITFPEGVKIKVGGKVITIGPGTVPMQLGETPGKVLRRLREAGKKQLFPPIAANV